MDSRTGKGFRSLGEAIIDHLKEKRLDPDSSVPAIKEIDFYSFDPWELPGLFENQSVGGEWHFFSKPKYKGAKRKRSGQQQQRRTKSGTWKKTGSGSKIKRKNGEVIGTKDVLVFIPDDIASKKAGTEWVMHEIAVADDPLYKENFVVCRLAIKNGVSTADEHQSSQDFASCSSANVVEDIFVASAQPPDQHLVSKTNHVEENIFSKTQLPPSENLFSCSEDSATNSLDSEVLPRDHLISYSGNHGAENTILESVIPATQQFVSNSNHVAENNILVSQVLPSDYLISYSRNDVAENTSAESQLPPSQYLVSFSRSHFAEITAAASQLLASQNLASYSRNHVAEIASLESQQQPNHLISYSRNHVAENTSTGLQLEPHDILKSLRLPDQHLAAFSTSVVGNSLEVEPRLLAGFNTNGGFNGLNDASFSALRSPIHLEQESSYSSGPRFGCDLLDSQFNSEQVIAFSESQKLPNHLISYSRNHVAENTSTGLQLEPHDILKSLRLPDQHLAAFSTSVVGNSLEVEPQLLAGFNTNGGFNGLNDASFSALRSPIHLEQESSYSSGPRFGCDLLDSQFNSEQVTAFSESQKLPNHLISYSRNHVAENTSTGLQPVPHDILESPILPNEHWAAYSTNVVENSLEAQTQLLTEFNTNGGYNGHASFLALQSPIYLDQESLHTNGPSFGCDLLNSKLDGEQVIAFPESQQLPNLISYSRNHFAKNTSTELQLVPHDTLESLIPPSQYWVAYSTSTDGNSLEAEPQTLAGFTTLGGYNGLNNASFSALQSSIYPEQESLYSNGPSYGCDFLNSQFVSEQVDELINSRRAFENEHSHEETAQSTLHFNSSKLDGGVYEVDSSDMDTESFNA